MNNLKIIIFLLLLSTNLQSQTNVDKETKAVFKSFLKDKREVVLKSSIDSFSINQLYQHLSKNYLTKTITHSSTGKTVSDTLFLNPTELLYIDSCVNAMSKFNWTDSGKNKLGLERFRLLKSDELQKQVV